MRFHGILGRSLAVAVLLASPSVRGQSSPADDARGAWMLGLGAQVDEEESDSVLATLYAGVGASTWLTFAAGQSSSPADRADIDADTLAVGIDQRFDKVGFTFEVERWGDPEALETEDLSTSVYFERERWRMALGYEARDLEIPFTLTGPLGGTVRRDVRLSADRVSLDARVAIAERWQLYLGLAEHHYERSLHVLPRIESLNLLSTSTLTLANSFLDHERYVAAERELGRVSLNVRVATDRSAVDGSRLDTLEAAALFPIGNRVDVEVSIGDGRSDSFDAGLYGGLLFLVYGR